MHRISIRDLRVRLPSSSPPHIFSSRRGLTILYLCRMKCLLFALVKKFEFSLVLPAEDIAWWCHVIVRRPFVKGEERDGPKLPLYVKIHVPEA